MLRSAALSTLCMLLTYRMHLSDYPCPWNWGWGCERSTNHRTPPLSHCQADISKLVWQQLWFCTRSRYLCFLWDLSAGFWGSSSRGLIRLFFLLIPRFLPLSMRMGLSIMAPYQWLLLPGFPCAVTPAYKNSSGYQSIIYQVSSSLKPDARSITISFHPFSLDLTKHSLSYSSFGSSNKSSSKLTN